jgi:hypothetical protein
MSSEQINELDSKKGVRLPLIATFYNFEVPKDLGSESEREDINRVLNLAEATHSTFEGLSDAASNYIRNDWLQTLQDIGFEPNIPFTKALMLFQICEAFSDIWIYLNDNTILLTRGLDIEERISDLDLKPIVFKDVLKNLIQGRGSLIELLQFSLAADLLEHLLLFRDDTIGYETLLEEVKYFGYIINSEENSDDTQSLNSFELHTIIDIDEQNNDLVSRSVNDISFDSIGLVWKPNIMVKKVWRYWNLEKFSYKTILSNLSEAEWRDYFFTKEFLRSLPSERISSSFMNDEN